MAPESGRVPRRRFLGQLAAGAGLVAGALSGCAAMATHHARLIGGRIPLELGELTEALGLENAVLVSAPGLPEPILLIRMENGSFQAVGAKCTHLGCQVQPARHFLTCPCHGSTFNLDGEVVRGPAQKALPRYRVEVKNGSIEIVVS